MTKEQVLGFKPAPRLEQVDDEHSKRVQDCRHRRQSCDDSALRCESQAGWNFRKGHHVVALRQARFAEARWNQPCGPSIALRTRHAARRSPASPPAAPAPRAATPPRRRAWLRIFVV